MDFEFLIIDDGSTDDSIKIIRSYRDSRIRLIENKKNIGQSTSLNKGLDLALGEYIARMDQDDVSFPKRLQRQVQYLEDNPDVCIVGTWLEQHDENNRTIRTIKLPMNKVYECGFWVFGYGENIFAHPSVMFKTKEIIALGGYGEDYDIAQDVDLWFRSAAKGFQFSNIPEVLFSYRIHSNQGSKIPKCQDEHNKALALLLSGILLQNVDPHQAARLRPVNFNDKYFSSENQIDEMFRLKEQVLRIFFKQYNLSAREILECAYWLWESLFRLCQLKFIRGSKMALKSTRYCFSILRSELSKKLKI
jgi:glycosyltransferase involved in cell wall biosynthesis